jgi:methionyl-tRNA synthetase
MKKFQPTFVVPEIADIRNLASKAATAVKESPKVALLGMEKAGEAMYDGVVSAQERFDSRKQAKQLKAKLEELHTLHRALHTWEGDLQAQVYAKEQYGHEVDTAMVKTLESVRHLGHVLSNRIWEIRQDLGS